MIEDLRPDIKPQIINHLISPTKLFASDKVFDIESERNINLKYSNEMGESTYDNIIDLPIRGSIRGSLVRQSFTNQKLAENNKKNSNILNCFAEQNEEFLKKKTLENVNENEDLELENFENDKEYDSSESEESKEKEKEHNKKKGLTIKLSPCLYPSSHEQPIQEINVNTEDIVENNNNANEKNSLKSYSITERDSKFIGRKIFIPNLKNTTNSCHLF